MTIPHFLWISLKGWVPGSPRYTISDINFGLSDRNERDRSKYNICFKILVGFQGRETTCKGHIRGGDLIPFLSTYDALTVRVQLQWLVKWNQFVFSTRTLSGRNRYLGKVFYQFVISVREDYLIFWARCHLSWYTVPCSPPLFLIGDRLPTVLSLL